jgi:hypothetical protein
VDQPSRLFDPLIGTLCRACPWLEVCGAADSEHACRSITRTVEKCGPGVLHPSDPATGRYLRSVGGPSFDTVTASPVVLPGLPRYLAQVRTRSALAGSLDELVYAIRADVAIGRRAHVLPAAELKTRVGLRPTQKLVLLLFGQDHVLERLWKDSLTLLPQIATAGYDLVVAPSYSTWTPRPRTEHLYNLKRSLFFYGVLQRLGVSAVPRLAWVIEQDIRRDAAWVLANPAVELVGLDWTTYRADMDWRGQVEGLGLLDRLTGRRLKYLINGPTTSSRCADIFTRVGPGRIHLTNSTLAPPPPDNDKQLLLGSGGRSASTFESRCAVQRRAIAEGEQIARAQSSERPLRDWRKRRRTGIRVLTPGLPVRVLQSIGERAVSSRALTASRQSPQ